MNQRFQFRQATLSLVFPSPLLSPFHNGSLALPPQDQSRQAGGRSQVRESAGGRARSTFFFASSGRRPTPSSPSQRLRRHRGRRRQDAATRGPGHRVVDGGVWVRERKRGGEGAMVAAPTQPAPLPSVPQQHTPRTPSLHFRQRLQRLHAGPGRRVPVDGGRKRAPARVRVAGGGGGGGQAAVQGAVLREREREREGGRAVTKMVGGKT